MGLRLIRMTVNDSGARWTELVEMLDTVSLRRSSMTEAVSTEIWMLHEGLLGTAVKSIAQQNRQSC